MRRISTQFFTIALLMAAMGCTDEDNIVDEIGATEFSYTIVDTDQYTCFDAQSTMNCPSQGDDLFGQDAQYEDYSPRYKDNGDGTVTDQVSGLMWQQDPGDKKQYDQAIADAESFSLAGYDDWRVPTIKELYSLILFSGRDVDPMAEESGDMTPFINDESFEYSYGDTARGERVIDSQWVTSSIYTDTVMGGEECFFGVNFADGRIKCYPTMERDVGGYFAIYVRGNADYGENDFSDNGDGTISDEATGLMWMQDDSDGTLDWEEALSYCETLELAGHDDWKLPNAKQLQSLVDYSRSPGHTNSAAIDPIFACTGITNEMDEADFGFFWTGTTHANQMGGHSAVYVSFGRGLGYMNDEYMDVHGAGCQRSDPKAGNPDDLPAGQGPQGDVQRIYNFARCVRDNGDFNSNPDGNDSAGDDQNPGDNQGPDGNEPPQDGEAPPPLASCSEDADCQVQENCPSEAALGCGCLPAPEGGNFCIPLCETDQDCPSDSLALICDPQGICIPQNAQPQ